VTRSHPSHPNQEELSEPEIVRIAEELEEKPDDEVLDVLHDLTPGVAGEVLERLDPERSSELLSRLRRSEAAEILEEMSPDTAVDVMEELPEARREELLRRMEPEEAAVLERLIAYPPDSAGGLMSPDVVALPEDLTVAEAIEVLRRMADEAETLYYAYVVDRDRKLLGVLSMRDLILSSPQAPIREIMRRDVVRVPVDMDVEEVARFFDRYDFLALPVVDADGKLLGIVTFDDVIDTIREEQTEDMQRLVGVAPEDRALDPWHESLRRRLPWLLVNLLTAFAAAGVVAFFEGTIAKVTKLVIFMPIIAGQGGNAGSQTVTVVVRGMALGEVKPGEGWRIVLKEVVLGAVHGLIIGAIVASIALLWEGTPMLGVVVALAMIFNLVLAGIAGALIPLGLRFLGADPALASTIFLTTVTDICGFFFLLGLGTVLLS
jgi:magnesium transporter